MEEALRILDIAEFADDNCSERELVNRLFGIIGDAREAIESVADEYVERRAW